MSNQWFKFYGQEFLSDMKISQLTIPERMLWVTILCLASSEDKMGEIEFCNESLLKSKMGLLESDAEWKELEGVLMLFEKMRMISFTDTGIFVKNFTKKQEKYLTPAEKMNRYRDKKSKVTNVTHDEVTNVTSNRVEESRVEESRVDKDIYTPSFEEFWKLYPKKNGKKQSLVQWKKLHTEDHTAIMSDIPKRMEDDKWVSGFVKDPERYLKYRQWEDEIQKPRHAKNGGTQISNATKYKNL